MRLTIQAFFRVGDLFACGIFASVLFAQQLSAQDAVKVVTITEQPVVRTTTQPATVKAYYSAEIYAKVDGYVAETNVDIGDRVKRGDVLATINVPELEKQLAVRTAQVASAEASEASGRAGVKLAEAQFADARAGVIEAQANIAAAEAMQAATDAELVRTKSMVATGTVQQKILDEAQQRRDSASAEVEARRAAVTRAESRADVAQASIAAAEAQLQAAAAETQVAKAHRDEASVMVGYCELKAPFAGVVTHRGIDPGDLVRAGQPSSDASPHFVVEQVDKLRVETIVPERDAPLVDIGDEVSISFAANGSASLLASISRAAGRLDARSRTMMVECEVENKGGELLPGMYGEATIKLFENPSALTLPASAIRFDATGNSFIYTVSDDKVTKVPVTIGYDDGPLVAIEGDVAAGAKVIDAHIKRFSDGDVVRVLP